MSIPMPDREEKKRSIEAIINTGLSPKKTLLTEARGFARGFGIKNLFFGIEDCILAAFACTIAGITLWAAVSGNINYPHFSLFMITPLFYVAASLLSIWKDDHLGVLEVKRTYKYSPEYLLVFRMLALSMINMLLIIPPTAAVSNLMHDVMFFRLLLVSLSSKFIYSVCMTAMLLKSEKPTVITALPIVWVLILSLLRAFMGLAIEEFLVGASIFALAVCVVVAAALYIAALGSILKRGGKEHVYI